MVKTALAAAANWHGSSVFSAPSIKPLDEIGVAEVCRQHPVVVVIEEHSVHGGLGSAVAEIAAAYAPTRICRTGVQDRFSERCGSYAYLMREHGLDLQSVCERVERFLVAVGIATHSRLSERRAA
jgi:transketolase